MAEASGDQDETVTDGRERVSDVLGSLKDAADTIIEEQKARVAETIRGFARALRRSADAFAGEGGTTIARAAGELAERVEEFSDTVRGGHWRAVLADLEDGVRARPELSFTGAFAAGFLVSRLMAGAASRSEAEP